MRGVCKGRQNRFSKLSSIDNAAVATAGMARRDFPVNTAAEDVVF
jgi:hypothetical protein